jgi:hypothetical protein
MGFAHYRCPPKQNIVLKMVGNNKDIAHPTKTTKTFPGSGAMIVKKIDSQKNFVNHSVIVGVETGVQTLVCAYAKLKLADSDRGSRFSSINGNLDHKKIDSQKSLRKFSVKLESSQYFIKSFIINDLR